jgi:hypothetical protein
MFSKYLVTGEIDLFITKRHLKVEEPVLVIHPCNHSYPGGDSKKYSGLLHTQEITFLWRRMVSLEDMQRDQ